MEDRIVICGRDINADVNTVFNEKTLRDDDILINNILEYAETIKDNGGEIFKHEKILSQQVMDISLLSMKVNFVLFNINNFNLRTNDTRVK